MPADFAYMHSVKNLKPMFERIQGAGTPPKFTLEFLKSLGYGSSTDRPVIGVMKALKFLNNDGTPTERYNEYRNSTLSGRAVAAGLRDGWTDLFMADQKANEKASAQLTELFKSVSGKGEAVAKKMATTFKTLCEMADWTTASIPEVAPDATSEPPVDVVTTPSTTPDMGAVIRAATGLSLHHDVHLHLPSTSDVSVYTAIFRALKAELLD